MNKKILTIFAIEKNFNITVSILYILIQATLEGVFEVMQDSVDSVGVSILYVSFPMLASAHFSFTFLVDIVGSIWKAQLIVLFVFSITNSHATRTVSTPTSTMLFSSFWARSLF